MNSVIEVAFPGGMQVDAYADGFAISTDQSEKYGGAGGAPEPFTLFVASIATCAGFYALRFCQTRKIDATGMTLQLTYAWDPAAKRVPSMDIRLALPEGFPEKHKAAIVRVMDQCVVKKHIIEPPAFTFIAE